MSFEREEGRLESMMDEVFEECSDELNSEPEIHHCCQYNYDSETEEEVSEREQKVSE